MSVLHRMRARLALRQRFRNPVQVKHEAQLRWWLETWDPQIRAGGLNPQDALDFLAGEQVESSYGGRRWQLARSQVARVLQEAAIEDPGYFAGKVVVEVGPGPLGFPDACPARVSIGVDPLAQSYADHGLLLPQSPAVYLTAGAEKLPLLSHSADVVLARDTLDYVEDPERALSELRRIVRPAGRLILMFDVDHLPTPAQPNALSAEWVKARLTDMTIIRERQWPEPFGADGHRALVVADVPSRYDRPADERQSSGRSTNRTERPAGRSDAQHPGGGR